MNSLIQRSISRGKALCCALSVAYSPPGQVKIQVKFRSPQNISGDFAAEQRCRVLLNKWSSWGLNFSKVIKQIKINIKWLHKTSAWSKPLEVLRSQTDLRRHFFKSIRGSQVFWRLGLCQPNCMKPFYILFCLFLFLFLKVSKQVPICFSCLGERCSSCFTENPQKCFADYETSPDFSFSARASRQWVTFHFWFKRILKFLLFMTGS